MLKSFGRIGYTASKKTVNLTISHISIDPLKTLLLTSVEDGVQIDFVRDKKFVSTAMQKNFSVSKNEIYFNETLSLGVTFYSKSNVGTSVKMGQLLMYSGKKRVLFGTVSLQLEQFIDNPGAASIKSYLIEFKGAPIGVVEMSVVVTSDGEAAPSKKRESPAIPRPSVLSVKPGHPNFTSNLVMTLF